MKYVLCIKDGGYKISIVAGKVYPTRTVRKVGNNLIYVRDESQEWYMYSSDHFVPISVPKEARALFTKRRN